MSSSHTWNNCFHEFWRIWNDYDEGKTYTSKVLVQQLHVSVNDLKCNQFIISSLQCKDIQRLIFSPDILRQLLRRSRDWRISCKLSSAPSTRWSCTSSACAPGCSRSTLCRSSSCSCPETFLLVLMPCFEGGQMLETNVRKWLWKDCSATLK